MTKKQFEAQARKQVNEEYKLASSWAKRTIVFTRVRHEYPLLQEVIKLKRSLRIMNKVYEGNLK